MSTLIATLVLAATTVIPPAPHPGFCTASRWQHRDVVGCRWPGADQTGDGVPEIVELRLVFRPVGGIDCSRSFVIVLDPTRERNQAISVTRAC